MKSAENVEHAAVYVIKIATLTVSQNTVPNVIIERAQCNVHCRQNIFERCLVTYRMARVP